jgi:phospholipid-binding lipoprotein MlaA
MRMPGYFLVLLLLLAGVAGAQEVQGIVPDPQAQETLNDEWDDFEDWEEFDDPFAVEEVRIADPLERLNRATFWFNDRVYFYLLKPVARAYRIVPSPARRSVQNFYSNITFPVRFVNNALQLKFSAAGNETRRFLLNSTVGLAGFLDPAAQHGWHASNEDFGQTLGHYGAGGGFYLVIPFIGPSTLRDGTGRIVDTYLDPLTYMLEWDELIAARTYETVNDISLDDDTYEKLIEQAIDPYLFIRNAYIQRRQALIRR